MVELYRRLLAGDDAPEALREAQLALRRSETLGHPRHWAFFTLVAGG